MTKFSEKGEKTIGDFSVVKSAAIDENGVEKDVFHLKENDVVVVICHDPAFNFYCVRSETPTVGEVVRLPQAKLKGGEAPFEGVLALLKSAFEISPDKVLSISRLMTGMTDSVRSTRHEYLFKVLVESNASNGRQTARADEVLAVLSSPDAQLSHKLLWSLIAPEVENYYRMISSKDGNSASE